MNTNTENNQTIQIIIKYTKHIKNRNIKNIDIESINRINLGKFINYLKYIFLYLNIINYSINIFLKYNEHLFKRKIT